MNRKSTSAPFDEDTPITRADIEAGKLVLRKRVEGRLVQPKKRVTLYLDASLIEHFKQMAGERGYQTLINETLKNALLQSDIETAIRKIIREELGRKKAA
ncbi:MAG: BrnA antitoxin family protein [Betaproteobacteria bacterium]|nr:BrnA antitoxin family protein [Betaproteobacteria bacterium]